MIIRVSRGLLWALLVLGSLLEASATLPPEPRPAKYDYPSPPSFPSSSSSTSEAATTPSNSGKSPQPLHSSSSPSSIDENVSFTSSSSPTHTPRDPMNIPDTLDPSSCPPDFTDHPLVLVSMDGFRADFILRGYTPTIAKLAKLGVYAPYIKPSFPSITFPNHYTIVTGLIPPAHGIIANRFTDPLFNASFAPGRPESFQKRFWGGEPIWKTVENQGQIAATYFWPGSEVEGLTPTHWFPFSQTTPFSTRVNQVLAWLDLPKQQRPRFITLYMHEPDSMGHNFGPDSKQENDALELVDLTVRMLVEGLIQRNILSCVNLIVLADHGMAQAGPHRVIRLDHMVPNFANRTTSLWNGIFARFNAKDKSYDGAVSLMRDLSCRRRELKVYHKRHAPARWHLGAQRRIEDVVVDLDKGFQADGDGTYTADVGDHGYDNYISDMNALFLAHGPAFRRGMEVEAFQNTEVYNLLCLLTDSTPAPNNGTWGALHHLLVNPPAITSDEKAYTYLPVAWLSDDWEELEDRLEKSDCFQEADLEESMTWLQPLYQAQAYGQQMLSNWHAPWGLPVTMKDDAQGTVLLLHQSHVSAYSRAMRAPLWTSFFLEASKQRALNSTRPWLPEPRLRGRDVASVCATQPLLKNTGSSWQPLFRPEFARSHEASVSSQLSSNGLVLTRLLQRSWHALADALQVWRRRYDGVQVVAGPVFDGDADSIKDDYKKWGQGGGVVVPTHLFVVVMRCHLGFGNLRSCPYEHLDTIAFILPQFLPVENCLDKIEFLREFSAKVTDVELITGLQFFPNLPVADRTRLKIRIHSNLWGRETWENRLRSDFFGVK